MHENWVQPSSCPSGLWWKLHRAPAYKDGCGSVEPIRSISTGILISCYSLLQFTISKTFWWFHSNYKNTTTCQRSCVWCPNEIKHISLKKERSVLRKSDIFSQFWSTCTWSTLHNLSTLSCIWVLFMSFAMYNHNRHWLCIGTCQPEVIQNIWTFNLVNECMFFGTKALWILDYYAKCDGNITLNWLQM